MLEFEGDRNAAIENAIEWHGLQPSAIHAAIAYCDELSDEIDERIERNRSLGERLRAEWRAEQGLPPE
ncbi:MAG: hypothetical protein U0893_20050 [Chloroflexota bacterium]